MKRKFWRGLTELNDSEAFDQKNAKEFAPANMQAPEVEEMEGVNRRQFIGLMSASAALMATACSDYKDQGEIIPQNDQGEFIPGHEVMYASSVTLSGRSQSVLIKTREGRPIKINGNPEHPVAKGVADAQAQALIMSLYEPDRLRAPSLKGAAISWADSDTKIAEALAAAKASSKKIVLLSGGINSESQVEVLNKFKSAYPTAEHYSYELNASSSYSDAWKSVLGNTPVRQVALDEAKVVLTLENDFLGSEATSELRRSWAERRNVVQDVELSKFVAVEGDFSLTGTMADERLRIKPALQGAFLKALMAELALKDSGLANAFAGIKTDISLEELAKANNLNHGALEALVKAILHHKGSVACLVGRKHSKEVQALGLALQLGLGESLLSSKYAEKTVKALSSKAELAKLTDDLNAGQVAVAINLGANFAWSLPAKYKFAAALAKAELSVSFSILEDETAKASSIVLPLSHALESWGDAMDKNGLANLQQPVIAPLFGSRQWEDCLIAWADVKAYDDTAFREQIRNLWTTEIYAKNGTPLDARSFWQGALHDGFVRVKPSADSALSVNSAYLASISVKSESKGTSLFLKTSQFLGDGSLANVGWLQEMPHPVSKVTWDNYAAFAPATAERLGLMKFPKSGEFEYDMVSITTPEGQTLEVVAFAQPGLAEDQIVLELGNGRTHAGAVGSDVGFNANVLLSSSENAWMIEGVEVKKLDKTYTLAVSQENNAIDIDDMGVPVALGEMVKDAHHRRHIVLEGTLSEYQEDPDFINKQGHGDDFKALDRPHTYEGVKWGMAIDLNKCIGCGDCVVSCNSENNIPVVGKDQVLMGREMHWMRIDRYYAGSSEEPVVSVQPMLCQHCDNAPCENVCPVVATVHSPEGLNEMAYNRCVGTRYCANNCPYKVRRFNYYNYRDYFANEHQESKVAALMANPEVTVRARGVIEKCSFCVQRINAGRAESKRQGVEWAGQGVVSACQEACPTSAIAFGNVNDANSDVAKLKKHQLHYRVLAETGVQPNVHYLAKLRNKQGKVHS